MDVDCCRRRAATAIPANRRRARTVEPSSQAAASAAMAGAMRRAREIVLRGGWDAGADAVEISAVTVTKWEFGSVMSGSTCVPSR